MERIIDRGRGAEIAGTRITVYDILDYHTKRWHHTLIAATLNLSSAQVLAAIEYIEMHKDEVMANYQKMLDRSAQGNPPEIQALLDAIHAEGKAMREARRLQKLKQEANHEGNSGGRECSGTPEATPANLDK